MEILRKSSAFDVTIIGAGIAGLSLAFELKKLGRSVLVVEKDKIGSGASGGLVGALAPHMPENWNPKRQYQLESFRMAPKFWAEVSRISGQSTGFHQNGRLQRIGNARGLEVSHLRAKEAQNIWEKMGEWRICNDDNHPFVDAPFGYVHDTLSAQIHPRAAVLALAKACMSSGVEIVENTQIFDPLDLLSDAVVIAAGYQSWPWLRSFLGASFGEGVKGQAALLRPREDWIFPMVTGDGFYIVPHSPREIAVGSTSEGKWKNLAIDHELDALIEKVVTLCPQLKDAQIVQTWAGVRPRAYRPDPLVGHIENRLWLNGGGFKTGFGFAPKIARDLAQDICGKPVNYPNGFRVRLDPANKNAHQI